MYRIRDMRARISVFAVSVALLFICVNASAALPQYTVIPGNPLTIYVGEDNSFQVLNANMPGNAGQIYPTDGPLGDMGWLVKAQGTHYAPDFGNHETAGLWPLGSYAHYMFGSYTPYTPVSLSNVSGSGTLRDPYTVTVASALGATGLTATMKVTYVDGDEYFSQWWTIDNASSQAQDVNLFFAADMALNSPNDDRGMPMLVTPSNSPGSKDCSANYHIILIPQTPADAYTSRSFGQLWNAVRSGQLNNVVDDPNICKDIAAALQWDRTIASGESLTLAQATSFGDIPSIAHFNVVSIDPPAGERASSVDVEISGLGFESATTFDLGAGITLQDLTIQDANSATATLNIAASAPLGPHDVNGTQSVSGLTAARINGFVVLANGNAAIASIPLLRSPLIAMLAAMLALLAVYRLRRD